MYALDFISLAVDQELDIILSASVLKFYTIPRGTVTNMHTHYKYSHLGYYKYLLNFIETVLLQCIDGLNTYTMNQNKSVNDIG